MSESKYSRQESSKKQELFYEILRKKGINTLRRQEIPRRDITKPIPLSFSQQWLWSFKDVKIDSPYYTIPNAIRIIGPLDIPVLASSLRELIQRHEILRTTFQIYEGKPVQVIGNGQNTELRIIDLQSLSADEQEREIRRRLQEEVLQRFDLSKGPLIRAHLLRLGNGDHILLLSLHHLISDGWSRGVLTHDLSAIYSAFTKGQSSPLPRMPFQYADYAAWQRDWFQGEIVERQMAYWRKHLIGAPTILRLPIDHPRPKRRGLQGDYCLFTLSSSLRERLITLSQRNEATLFMTLLAAFQIMMSLYTEKSDLVIFTRIANRSRADLKNLIGCFFKMLPLRINLSEKPTFLEVLNRSREICKGAYANQDVPFDHLLQMLHKKDASSSGSDEPQIQVIFELVNFPKLDISAPGLDNKLMPLRVSSSINPFELDLTMIDAEQNLSGVLEYSSELFDTSTINDIIKRFISILEDVAANPDSNLLL